MGAPERGVVLTSNWQLPGNAEATQSRVFQQRIQQSRALATPGVRTVLPTPLPDGLKVTLQASTVAVAVATLETVVVVVVVVVVVEEETTMVVTVVVVVVVLVADAVCYTSCEFCCRLVVVKVEIHTEVEVTAVVVVATTVVGVTPRHLHTEDNFSAGSWVNFFSDRSGQRERGASRGTRVEIETISGATNEVTVVVDVAVVEVTVETWIAVVPVVEIEVWVAVVPRVCVLVTVTVATRLAVTRRVVVTAR